MRLIYVATSLNLYRGLRVQLLLRLRLLLRPLVSRVLSVRAPSLSLSLFSRSVHRVLVRMKVLHLPTGEP